MVWINAPCSGGGQIITNPEAGRNATPSLASEAGAKAPRSSATRPLAGGGRRPVDR